MALMLTDDEIGVLSQLQRVGPAGVLSDLVEVVRRMPSYFWTDTADDLRTAEKRATPGRVCETRHHDARGVVHTIEGSVERRRQGARRKAG